MKLDELRKRLQDPEEDEIDVVAKAHFAAKISQFTTIVGVDFACGIDSCVYALTCVRCGLVQLTAPPNTDAAVNVACPKCDGACVMCGISHDENGDRERIQETGPETDTRRVCDRCRYDYYDILANRFVTEKQP